MKIKNIIPVMAIVAGLSACSGEKTMKSGIDTTNMDLNVSPGESFYDYACGGWMKKNPLPAAYARFGSFDQLALKCTEQVHGILDELAAKNFDKGTDEQKISDFYKLAMDSVRRNKEGVAPAKVYVDEIEAAKTKADLDALQDKYALISLGKVYHSGFGADEKEAKNNILNVMQGGIALGEKEYYLDNDPETAKIREAYKAFIQKMFGMYGFDEAAAQKKMNDVMKIETALAKVSKSRTEMRDPEANYNKMTIEEFEQKYPNLRLSKLMEAMGVKSDTYKNLVLGQPAFAAGANTLLTSLSPEELKSYFEWDIINGTAQYLSDEVAAAAFDFYGKTMKGRKQDYERWKKCTNQVEGVFGENIGKIYCEKYFPASSKERMQTLVKNLQTSLGERIKAQDWMSDSTKANAIEKLNTFYVKIGYPDKWKDLGKLTIDPEKSYFENMIECQKFRESYEIETKAGKPVDRDEWYMTPQTVNAYYNPTTNEICFPAGILQYPFFDADADDAFNYGAIGVVIGHEMTHGFDDQGRKYDKDGNMKDWWTDADAENFKARTSKYADFFSNIEVLPGLKGNGALTLGENLADHGGLQVAFNAYKNATKDNPLPEVDSLTADQRFFLAYAGVWANNITDEEIRSRVKSDPHSLGRWRVDGALPHIDAWYEAFGIKEGDKMFIPQEERLKLW